MQKRILIKIGGRAFADDRAFKELAQDIKENALQVIVVHGGGAEISQALQQANRETVFVDGVRVTQKEDVEIVEDVLSEIVNGRIAASLERVGIATLRLSGKSDGLLIARRTTRNGKDIGLVGEIVQVNPAVVWEAMQQGLTPIVSPISADKDGVTYNVNADTAAAALAVGSECTDLVYFSDVPGILDEKGYTIPSLSVDAGTFLIQSGVISGGMVAKMESIFEAIEKGVERIHITKWQGSGTLSGVLRGDIQHKTTIHK